VRLVPFRYLLALFAVAVACVGVIALSGRAIERQKRDRAHEAAEIVTATISSQVASADATLEDTAAFFGSSRDVSQHEFTNFARAALRRPGIRGLSFAQYVPERRRAAFEREHGVRISSLDAEHRVAPAPHRSGYFPIVLSVSTSKSSPTTVGFDGSGEPVRGAAIDEAVRTRQPIATPPLRTVAGKWRPLLYAAVFTPGGRLEGFTSEALDPTALVKTAQSAFPGSVGVRVLDGNLPVFSSDDGDYSHAQRRTISVAGRQWTVEVVSHASLGPAENLRWIVALGGLLLLTTLFILFRRALRQTEDAERLVRERTAELDAALRDADTARAALSERNESLLELDRFKDRMLALISHDLRSPLTSIRGYVELLLDEETGPLGEDQQRFLNVIKRNSDRLDSQIGDLLMVAGIAEGSLSLNRTAVDLPRLVMEAVETAAPTAQERGIELHAGCEPLHVIYADGPRLSQVLDNLISNAIKYTPAGGRVDVRSFVEDDWVSLSVTDTGLGMSRDELDSIFDPFFRTDDAKERGIKGTGLGLVIVKAIVEGHGGGVRVDSKPGQGSRFTISLPIDSPAPWAPPRRLTTLEA
jgi:signal transduction histidine kinase